MNKLILVLSCIIFLASCNNSIERLKRVGRNPDLAQIELPERDEEEIEYEKNKLYENRAYMRKTNSLWAPGSVTFFRDSRAWKVGDIITIKVVITDSAQLNNATNRNRKEDSNMGLSAFFGKEKVIAQVLSKKGNPDSLLNTKSSGGHKADGSINRAETIQMQIAALVNKVLPNGNLVIQGKQEVRVNSELREIKIFGIIRPKDIASDNSIHSNQIAEARISYGGRGVVSDVQQPKPGQEIIDAISPF